MLLMAYGGPTSLEEVEPFLRDVRGGRPTSPELVDAVRGRYAAIGGASPLLEITRAQAAALERRLGADEPEAGWRVWMGMRHWHPYIGEAVREIAAAGARRLVALCLTPQASRLSTGAYFARLDEALAAAGLGSGAGGGAGLPVARIASWHTEPLFLDALAHRVAAAWRPEVTVLFTAHSLPRAILAEGDPYERQLRETAEAVAARTEARTGCPLDWTFCYQSAAADARDWLGPDVLQVISRLAAEGCRHLVAAPVGFLSDHVEVLYDLDVEARQVAEAHGARLHRIPSLNASPDLVRALSTIVRTARQ
ncbi:MAG TPA: ferrochelatase [Thermoanaerobaculia bacterium]|nr:ferrochelatase [Thermoanaerobaculia bacterium]